MGLARRNRIAKTTAAALALLVQVGGLALLLMESGESRRPEARAIRIRVMPLTPRPAKPESRPPPEALPAARTRSAAPSSAPVAPQIVAPDEPSRAITPPTDWYAEAENIARQQVERDARLAREGQPLDSKPQVLEIPEREAPYERSVTLPNGDLQTRTRTEHGEILCTHSRPAQDEMFSPWAKHRPASCTFRERPDTWLARDLEEEVKPRYLRKPPQPDATTETPR